MKHRPTPSLRIRTRTRHHRIVHPTLNVPRIPPLTDTYCTRFHPASFGHAFEHERQNELGMVEAPSQITQERNIYSRKPPRLSAPKNDNTTTLLGSSTHISASSLAGRNYFEFSHNIGPLHLCQCESRYLPSRVSTR